MKNFLGKAVWGLIFIGAAGCVRSGVTHESEGLISGAPYRKILVCSMTSDRRSAEQMETIMAGRLRRHHVEADTCTAFLYPLRESSSDLAAKIQEQHFDGVLVTQRVIHFPNASEKSRSSPRLKDILEGPSVHGGAATDAKIPDRLLADPFPSLGEFVTAYVSKQQAPAPEAQNEITSSIDTVSTPLGREYVGHARGDLIGLREDHTVWSTGGLVQGSTRRPLKEFLSAFAETIERGLLNAKVLPEK